MGSHTDTHVGQHQERQLDKGVVQERQLDKGVVQDKCHLDSLGVAQVQESNSDMLELPAAQPLVQYRLAVSLVELASLCEHLYLAWVMRASLGCLSQLQVSVSENRTSGMSRL